VSVHQTSIPGPPVISVPPSVAPARVAFALERTMECGNCLLHRPMTARHCSYCKACIKELDHHCPW
jgi:predicted amidophosphoribosyltransferase